jgi:DNA topoisomerase 2-associated protein PAT1
MTQHDKDVVNRIQLSQLASGDPYMDDFYYQVYSSLRRRAGLPTWQSTHNNSTGENGRGRGRREENMMQRMQQQLQRIVNEAKRRPKQTQVSLEGALGKITSLTVRNPRQVLQVSSQQTSEKTADQHHPPAASGESKTKVDNKRNVLKIIEDMYTIILELEQMSRQGPPVPREKDDGEEEKEQDELKDETLDAAAAFHEKLVLNTDKLWNALRIDESDDATPFLISLLSIAKGMKLIPRIFRQLSNDQSLTMLTVIVTHFSKLVVCRNVIYPGTAVADVDEAKKQLFVTYDNVELFMNATAPPLLRVIAEAPLSTVVHLFQLLIQKNNVVMVAQTKPGLAFLTMLLSRAEILKQGGGVLQGLSAPSQEELAHWQELYGYLFETLRNRYISTFPSMYYLVPIIPNTPMIQLSLNVDDIYVWQFLAAMAVGASMDQQHILVTDVR